MKKLFIFALMLSISGLIAGVNQPFKQFSDDGYYYAGMQRSDQNWLGASLIKMHVSANSSVWLSNYVNSWFSDDGIADLNTVYNMSAGNYGYINANDLASLSLEKSQYSPDIITFSNGETTKITYFSGQDEQSSPYKVTTTGYLLDTFKEDSDIFLVMTPLGKEELMDSYQYVKQDGHEATDLVSRVFGTQDLAGNTRINFGLHNEGPGREFVAVYTKVDDGDDSHQPSGQPLPGVFITGLLAFGTIATSKKLSKTRKVHV